jgi:hypothetical protein
MKKDLVLHQVKHSVSSIFTKEDVINLINSIEESKGRVITTLDIERAIENVISWAENNERDLVDTDSVEFELNHDNRIEVVGAPINTDNLREALENNFMDFGEAEEDEVEENKVVLEAIADNEL